MLYLGRWEDQSGPLSTYCTVIFGTVHHRWTSYPVAHFCLGCGPYFRELRYQRRYPSCFFIVPVYLVSSYLMNLYAEIVLVLLNRGLQMGYTAHHQAANEVLLAFASAAALNMSR